MYNECSIKGTQHLDAYGLTKFMARISAISLIKFDLESVSEKLFGKPKDKLPAHEINELWDRGELGQIVKYNREDGEVTLRLAREFLPLQLQLCSMLRWTISETCRSSSSQMVEQLLIIKSVDTNLIVPNKPNETQVNARTMQTYEGGFVKEPLPGLHEHIAVLDFRSLHPSIMISHNISPDTFNCGHEECRRGKNVSPDGDWFCEKRKGFLTAILEEILADRSKLKATVKKMDKSDPEYMMLNGRQHALKILLNSHYGYLGYPRSRWYSREAARAITAWSRHYIQDVMHKGEENGFTLLYGDSITKDRVLPIKFPDGRIAMRTAEDLFDGIDSLPRLERGKQAKIPKNLLTLSVNPGTLETEWRNIKSVIRHKAGKKVYRVNQKFGETMVTQDHSLVIKDGGALTEVKPLELNGRPLFSAGVKNELPLLEEIDLFEELKNYTNDIYYKGDVKISQFHTDGEWIWFGWMEQKKRIRLMRHLKTDSPEFEALCRLLGAYIAEGSSSTFETTATRMGASLSSSNIPWLERLREDYFSLFDRTQASIIRSNKGTRTISYANSAEQKTIQYEDFTMKLQMMNPLSAAFFKVLCGQKSSGKRLPDFIFNVPERCKKLMLEKMVEGDGSRSVGKNPWYTKEYKEKNFCYTTKSLSLCSGLSFMLKQMGQKHSIQYRPSKTAYAIKTCTEHNGRVKTKITGEPYDGFVYDLSVEGNNNFADACGNILLHNTDSMFLKIPKEKTETDVREFMQKTNSELPESMELELDGIYRRGIFVTKKEGGAAKKKYALIDFKGNLKIVGFEYVRRDWAIIAKETQKNVIEAILKDGDTAKAIAIAKETIRRLKEGKVPKRELVIMKQLKRRPDNYDSPGPQVAAARKAMAKGKDIDVGSIIAFVITKGSSGSKKISDKAEIEEYVKEGDYDSEYYIEHQILPAVSLIMHELGYSKEDLVHGGKQKTLFGQWGN